MVRYSLSKTMSQKSITAYFKPNPSVKRTFTESQANNEDNDSTNPKKICEQKTITSDLSKAIRNQSVLTPALSDNIGQSWFRALKSEFSKDYFKQLSRFLESERKAATVYPPVQQVYSWTTMTDILNTKVVVIGQDPYHGPNQAHGLAFSVRKGVPPPPSLINIFKELESDIIGFKRPVGNHGDLTGWAKQGVLLLNACLTVRAHNANSHSDKGWEQLTDAVIKWLNTNLSSVVFLLWGSYAQKKGNFINKNKHLVLKSSHPSPLSARHGFIGCKHFSQANDYLRKSGKTPIDWNDLP